MTIGSPVLRVRNIERVSAFYERIGLLVTKKYQEDNNLIYEFGTRRKFSTSDKLPLVILQNDPEAKNASQRSAGLFHFAILVPERKSLASTYLALRDSGIRYDGFADHLVSESLYLRDPENNGIEIYSDRPSIEWRRDSEGHIMMDTLPLDLDSLVSKEISKEEEKEKAEAFPSGGRIGHMHLKVTNLERSIRFYHEKLGLDITVDWRSMGAAFLSAGGYHHHIGVNIWHSLNGQAHNSDKAGLKNFTITIPDKSFVKGLAARIYGSTSAATNENQLLVSNPDGIQFLIRSQ